MTTRIRSTVRPRKLPTQARAQATVDAVLEAAAQLLDESGYAGLNTNAIAERAGVSIGSLYQYFPNKAAICSELTRRYLERQAAAFADNLRDTWLTAPDRQIARTVRTTLAIARQDRRAAAILYKQLRFVPSDDTYRKATRRMEDELRRFYARPPSGAGFSNPDIAAFLVVNVMGILLGETIEQHPEWLRQERFAEELTALFAGYLTRRASAPVSR